MSDDDDYMSSAFLDVKEDIRPGLILSKQVKRKHEIEKKRLESNKVHRTKSYKQLEEESRTVGLNNAISSDNKGFAMLQKMGYKPGMKLGPQKESTSSGCTNSGLTEPIKVKLKTDRGGLGREEEIRKRIAQREERKSKIKVYKEEETERLTKEFRERMRSKVFQNYLMADLKKSQKVCQQLDAESNVEEPMRPWFWYSYEPSDYEEEDYDENDDDEIEPDEQLGFIIDYLRTKYLYCLWCGIKYETVEDMNMNCPGTEKGDHDECVG